MSAERDKFLGKDPFLYTQEQERFFRDLFQFHTNRGTAFHSLPTVSGKKVDLYLLYSLVVKHGGFHKVSEKNLWITIQPELFHLPPACVNTELTLKQMYMRYLYLYERVHVHGDDPDQREEEDSGEVTRGGKSGPILVHAMPMRYNYRQHRVGESVRRQTGLSTNLVRANEYERLEKSLLSGLNNEVDFAMNICTVLSAEGRHSMRLFSHNRMIQVILAQIGLFCEESGYKNLYENDWFPRHKRNFVKFWYENTNCESMEYGDVLLDLISTHDRRERDTNLYCGKTPLLGAECLHLGPDHPSKDIILCRVMQVANIMRNLSFDSMSARAMAESDLFFRFVVLCCHSQLPQLKKAGMDTMSNMCEKYILRPSHTQTTQLFFQIINSWLRSNDKQELVNALLSLIAIAKTEENEDALVESMTAEIYEIIITTARVYDLQLIISALDALYYISEIGEVTCEGIASVKYSVDFLVDLITVETQSFGESALVGVRVLEHAPPPPMPQQQPNRMQMTSMRPPPVPQQATQSVPPMQQPVHRPTSAPRPPSSQSPQVGGYKSIQPKPAPQYQAIAPRPQGGMLPATPQNLANMNPDQVACNWLRANYEQYPGSTATASHVHKDYGTWLQRKGLQLPCVPPDRFISCVRHVFPFANFVQNGSESMISGLRWKPPPNPQTKPAQPVQPAPQRPTPPPPGQPLIPINVAAMNSQSPLRVESPASISSMGMPSRIGSPLAPRAVSPAVAPVPSTKGNDVLRNMLLSDTDPTDVKTKPKPPIRRNSSPRPAVSPASLELQICGEAERVDLSMKDSMAKIERMENRSPGVASSKTDKTDSDKPSNEDLKTTNGTHCSEGDKSEKTLNVHVNGENDSPPSTTLSSPVLCNGNHSDSDSIHQNGFNDSTNDKVATKKRPTNGLSSHKDSPQSKKPRNGILKGMEKIMDTLAEEEKKKTAERRRQMSGDSEASMSSTSTILSSASTNQGKNTSGNKKRNRSKGKSTNQNSRGTPMTNHSTDSCDTDFSAAKSASQTSIGFPKSDSNDSISIAGSCDTAASSRQAFHCGWAECTMSCPSRSMLRQHVSKTHTSQEGSCRWLGCDNLFRKRWSLVSHVTEKHTNDASLLKSQLAGERASTVPSGPPAIYTAAAAKLAILRGFPNPPYQDLMDVREGPVTKHIRFTSALILRNLARYSPQGRSLLKKHESQLVYIAGSMMEASGTISNCLWELHQTHL